MRSKRRSMWQWGGLNGLNGKRIRGGGQKGTFSSSTPSIQNVSCFCVSDINSNNFPLHDDANVLLCVCCVCVCFHSCHCFLLVCFLHFALWLFRKAEERHIFSSFYCKICPMFKCESPLFRMQNAIEIHGTVRIFSITVFHILISHLGFFFNEKLSTFEINWKNNI